MGNVSSYRQHMEIAAEAGIQDTTNETENRCFGLYAATPTSCWCFPDEQGQQTDIDVRIWTNGKRIVYSYIMLDAD